MVSIIMPCYNLGQFIHEAIDSVINQTYTDWELIIVNDGSTDNSWELICAYISQYKDKKILIINQKNAHLSEARNVGIKHSCGQYVLPLDPDDIIESTYLEKTVNVLDNNLYIHVVGTWQQRFGEEHWSSPLDPNWDNIFNKCSINYCSMYRKYIWETIGGYDKNFIYAEDWDFWMSCKEHNFNYACIPEPLFYYRIRKESKMQTEIKDASILKQRYEMLSKKHPLYNEPIWF
jgi:glycosyltransferase involved in cell wall biosynthesis